MIAANTLLFFEEVEGQKRTPAEIARREYRIIATARTSTMETDLVGAAASHFRVIGAGSGYMTVVMERDSGSTPNRPSIVSSP